MSLKSGHISGIFPGNPMYPGVKPVIPVRRWLDQGVVRVVQLACVPLTSTTATLQAEFLAAVAVSKSMAAKFIIVTQFLLPISICQIHLETDKSAPAHET